MNIEEKIKLLSKNEYTKVKDQIIIDFLKVIFIDKETDIDQIEFKSSKVTTLKKYIEEKKEILRFINEEEFQELEKMFFYAIELKKQKKEARKQEKINSKELEKTNLKETELKFLRSAVKEIFDTRHLMKDIEIKNYFTSEKLKKYLNDEEFIEKNFGEGMYKKIKNKIEENSLIRMKVPKKYYLIEDAEDVVVTKQDIYFVNENDKRKISYVGNYLCSGADIEYVMRKYNTNLSVTLGILSDLKIKELIKPEFYEDLNRYLSIEKIMVNNELSKKKLFFNEILSFLDENNYDFEMAIKYFKIPEPFFRHILSEINSYPILDPNQKEQINRILYSQEEKKVK